MYIDPSRAKGLTKRFVRETSEQYATAKKKLFALPLGKKVEFYRNRVSKYLYNPFLSIYVGGSNHYPFILASFFDEVYESDIGDWQENLCANHALFMDLKLGTALGGRLLGFNASNHVIMRLYQRMSLDNISESDIGTSRILKQFEFIEICSAYWALTFTELKIPEQQLASLSIPIPCDQGLLYAKVTENRILSVRTFIDTDKLRANQKAIRKQLISAFEPFKNSIERYWYPIYSGRIVHPQLKYLRSIGTILDYHVCNVLDSAIAFDILVGNTEGEKVTEIDKYDLMTKLDKKRNRLNKDSEDLTLLLELYMEVGEYAYIKQFDKIRNEILTKE